MYKLCIVLGWPVIKMQLQNTYQVEYPELWAKIKQHKFVFSDYLDRYYSLKAEEEGLLEEYQCFMENQLYNDCYIEIRDYQPNLKKTLANFLKKIGHNIAIIISEENEFGISRSACKFQYSIIGAVNDENGPFGMYSVKASFFAKQGENAWKYLEWIRNIFKDEREVNIIDQYILNDKRNYEQLIKYYFPLIGIGCKLNIHTLDNTMYESDVCDKAKEHNFILKLFKYSEMHDRYITTSNRIIIIPLGCDFIKKDGEMLVVRRTTSFTMKQKDMDKEYLEIEKELAGNPLF